MINKEVIPAFDMLLEELERIIPDLNDQGKQLLDQKKYQEAHQLINKAQSVMAFQSKVKALQEEWVGMQVPQTKLPPPQKPGKKPKKVSRTTLVRLDEGLRTKNEDFHLPILQALINHDGSTKFSRLIDSLTRDMADILNKYDWETFADGKTIRWINNVGWAKKPLLDKGYLSSTAPKGTWEITDAGRQALEDSKKKAIAEPHQQYLPGNLTSRAEKPLFAYGQTYNRQTDLHDVFGGNRQSGISVCAKHPLIFLFETPSGKESGYQNGHSSDGTYSYTGEGSKGDMQFTRGNKAILNHQADGRELHLFKKEKSGSYKYLGQYEYISHQILDGVDVENKQRKTIQFNLKRVSYD